MLSSLIYWEYSFLIFTTDIEFSTNTLETTLSHVVQVQLLHYIFQSKFSTNTLETTLSRKTIQSYNKIMLSSLIY